MAYQPQKQGRRHRQHHGGGHAHQDPPGPGEQGPGRAIVVYGVEFQDRGQQGTDFLQDHVAFHPELSPLIRRQKRGGGEEAEEIEQHGEPSFLSEMGRRWTG